MPKNSSGFNSNVFDDRIDHIIDARTVRFAQNFAQVFGNVGRFQNSGAAGVVNIVVDVGNAVGKLDDDAFQRGRHVVAGMVDNSVAHFPGQVEPLAVVFQLFQHP